MVTLSVGPLPVGGVTLTSAFAIAIVVRVVQCRGHGDRCAVRRAKLVVDVENELFVTSNFGGQSPAKKAAPLGLPRPDAMS